MNLHSNMREVKKKKSIKKSIEKLQDIGVFFWCLINRLNWQRGINMCWLVKVTHGLLSVQIRILYV